VEVILRYCKAQAGTQVEGLKASQATQKTLESGALLGCRVIQLGVSMEVLQDSCGGRFQTSKVLKFWSTFGMQGNSIRGST
jgi:hypothetical protein